MEEGIKDQRLIANELVKERLSTILVDCKTRGYHWLTESHYPCEVLNNSHKGFTRTVSIMEVNPHDPSTEQRGSGFKQVSVRVMWGPEVFQCLWAYAILSQYS